MGLSGILNFAGNSETEFDRLQRKLNNHFSTAEKLRSRFNKNQKKLKDFVSINGGAGILPDSVANRVVRRRLNNRKLFTVFVDTVLSYNALNLVLKDTINPGFGPRIMYILSLLFAYGLLRMAIDYRNDFMQDNSGGFIKRNIYVVPLLFIPVMSMCLIQEHWNDPESIIWLFFLIFGMALNLMVAYFSPQYDLMEQSDGINKVLKLLEKKLEKIGDKIEKVMEKITSDASKLLQIWLTFPDDNKPRVYIFPQYRYYLNTRVYHDEVLPIENLTIIHRPGKLASFSDFMDSIKNRELTTISNEQAKIDDPAPAGTPKLDAPEDSPELQEKTSVQEEAPVLNDETEANNEQKSNDSPGKDKPDHAKWI